MAYRLLSEAWLEQLRPNYRSAQYGFLQDGKIPMPRRATNYTEGTAFCPKRVFEGSGLQISDFELILRHKNWPM